jgi:dihydroflavonol-4-reductase
MPAGGRTATPPKAVTGPVFLTGATGFIGGALLERLRSDGTDVRALVRSKDAAALVQKLGAVPVQGDLLGGADLAPAMSGCTLVFHAAGLNHFCLPDPKPLFRVNVNGTVRLIQAAARAGIPKLVYTSSAATLGEAEGSIGSEYTPHRGWFLSAYERSKYLAERAAERTASSLGVELICLNPSSVQGPGRASGTARWLISYANGRLRWFIQTRASLVDIADCTQAHVLAAARGVAGRRYVISSPARPIGELVQMVGAVTGRSYPVHYLPSAPAVGVGSVIGSAFSILGRKSPVCREMLRTLAFGHAYDGAPAARDLGFSYTPLEISVETAMRWYSEHGYLQRPLTRG